MNLKLNTILEFMMRFSLVVLLAFASTVNVYSQSSGQVEKPRFGLFGNYSIDLHSASFSKLPPTPNCCPEFTGGTGSGLFFGITYISPISAEYLLDMRVHFGMNSVDMRNTQNQPVISGTGEQIQASIDHTLSASLSQISIEPLLGYRLTPDLALKGGVMIGYRVGGTFEQAETLNQPANATFENNSRQRNLVSGDIANLSSIMLGVTLGASLDLPLNSDRTMFLSPEVLFTFSPLGLVQDVSWNMHHLRAGLAFTFIPPAVDDSLSDYELLDVARRTPIPQPGSPGTAFVADITSSGLSEDGRTSTSNSVRIEEFASTRVRPLLPYVFFNHNSAELPVRYRQLSRDQVESFSVNNFYNLDAMITYWHLLNIVANRLTQSPSATITVTGCTDNSDDAAGDLGKQRAEAVRSYLTKTWRIDASRINVVSRGLPAVPSNVNEEDGKAENRRVEITSNDPSIFAPVVSADTMRVFEPTAMRFLPSIDPRVPILSWTVFVTEEDRIIRSFHAGDPVPNSIDWRMAEQSMFIPRGTRNLEYMLVVQDSSGRVVPSSTKSIAVSEVTLEDKRKTGGTDKTIDRYSMILFAFDKADLSPDNMSVVDMIKQRITSGSQVAVNGYTDRSGSDDYNQRLSEQRAKSVSNALGTANAKVAGLGERLPLYDNSTPEGRFYSRTVEVTVETPRR